MHDACALNGAPNPPCVDTEPMSAGTQVLLQGFTWESHAQRNPGWYKVLLSKAETIAKAGITAVWLPPPSQSVSSEGYMPRELDNLDSAYGSEQDLRACIDGLHRAGIQCLCDVVLNHRCASSTDATGRWNQYGGRYAWDSSAICSNSSEFGGRGAHKQQALFAPAPNIDHSNPLVRRDVKHWLRWLRDDLQFDGWRFDFCKGYSGAFVQEYVQATAPAFAVGEFWDELCYDGPKLSRNQNPHRQRTVDWCDSAAGTAAAFDFTTKGILQEALATREFSRLVDAEGKPPGVVGWWPSRAVTWLDNHDTASTQNHWPFPSKLLWSGYAYILTHPGTPCVFYDHLFADGGRPRKLADCWRWGCMGTGGGRLTVLGSGIAAMIAIRRRNGITCSSSVRILEASDHGVYAAIVDDRVALRLGAGPWSPPPHSTKTWRVALSGVLFCIWELVDCPAEPCAAPARLPSAPNHAAMAAASMPTVARRASVGAPACASQADARSLPRHLSLDASLLAVHSRRSIDQPTVDVDHGVDHHRPYQVCCMDAVDDTVFAMDLPPCGRQPVAVCQRDVCSRLSGSTEGSRTALLSEARGGALPGVAPLKSLAPRESQRQLLVHT